MLNFKEAIASSNLLSKINSSPLEHPNKTYEIIEAEILKAKKQYLPSKKVRFDKYKHKKNNWITSAILQSIHFRDNLYRKLKTTNQFDVTYSTHKTNYNKYNKLLNKLIKDAKAKYYNDEFKQYNNNIKKTWQTINSIQILLIFHHI